MHSCMFVIIGKHDDPDAAVHQALEPFWAGLEVEPYRDYLDASDIKYMAEHYGIPPTDLPALAAKMEDWRCCEGGVDPHGLYAVTTYNSDSKWDWYEIGGRWNRYIPGSRRNVISAGALRRSGRLRRCLPCSLVTPEGRWLEHEGAGFGAAVTEADRQRELRWFATIREVLAQHIDHKVVCVDIHS